MAPSSFSVCLLAVSRATSVDRGWTNRKLPRAVSGGFAIVQPGSKLSINAVEGFPLEDFSADVSSSHTFHLD